MRTKLTLLLTLGLVLTLFAACAPAPQPTADSANDSSDAAAADDAAADASTADEAATGDVTYILVPKALGNPYFDTAETGAQEAAEELGVTVTYQGSATADATEQIQLLNSLIAQQVSGLAISANDADALVPVGQTAMSESIPVVTWDSAIAAEGRNVHINQADASGIASGLLELTAELVGGEGQVAILSATSTAPNQNEWIALMEEELATDAYANIEMVATVYGDDEDEKSYNEAVGLMQTYPDLKAIISPTTVGIAAAARAVQDQDRVGEVAVTGLGTPNQMREYVKSGAAPAFMLWNPADLGYLAIQTLNAIASGQIEGNPGDTFEAGRLGEYTINDDSTVLLGPPTVFDADNIDDFDF